MAAFRPHCILKQRKSVASRLIYARDALQRQYAAAHHGELGRPPFAQLCSLPVRPRVGEQQGKISVHVQIARRVDICNQALTSLACAAGQSVAVGV
jgi:hypothetical protein